MAREILLYGVLGGVLIAVLEVVEARFLVAGGSFGVYGVVIASLFAGLGIWLGGSVRGKAQRDREMTVPIPMRGSAATPFVRDERRLSELGLTPRELEILETIASGLSNREIAEKLFVSENTVKTHVGRLFDKLGARRRTQAVEVARRNRLIP